MAGRLNPLIAPAGGAAAAAVALVTLVPIAALIIYGDGRTDSGFGFGLTAADLAAVRFTLLQAVLSALLSVCFAVPIARALFWRQFWGRQFLISALGAPFLLPVIVAVLGLITVWGRSGWINAFLDSAGIGTINIYGLFGVLLAHVFFNLPLATRLFLQGWSQIPDEHFRIAEQMGMTQFSQFRHLEWPMLKSLIPGAFLLVLLICSSSFAVVLALGGGPKATTLELAIFESIRFDFDLARGANLAILQFLIGAVFAAVVLAGKNQFVFGAGLRIENTNRFPRSRLSAVADGAAIVLMIALLGLPLLAILLDGIPQLWRLPAEAWQGLWNSLAIALLSTAVSLVLGLSLSARIASLTDGPARFLEIFTMLALSASPLVIGTGLFILLQPVINPSALALPVTALVNAAMSLPFVVRILLPAQRRAMMLYAPLEDSLGISGMASARLVYWPSLRAPAGFAAGISAALSMGDLGVIALFAPPDFATLPLVVYSLMGSYRTDLADGAALLLVLSSFALFCVFDQGGRYGRPA